MWYLWKFPRWERKAYIAVVVEELPRENKFLPKSSIPLDRLKIPMQCILLTNKNRELNMGD